MGSREGIAATGDCESALSGWDAPELRVWLARDPHGLPAVAAMPYVAHVVANCAVPVLLPAAEVSNLVADPALRRELAGSPPQG